jgi:eukaryotic-like serine/threonine-protein kinase
VGRVFLGRYETIRLLGEGGMGKVFLAKQLDLGRNVVVKVMHDDILSDQKFRERFQRETLLMAQFVHPYAVTLYDASLNDPSGPCIVMEYIKGCSLEQLLSKNARLSYQRVGRLLDQLGDVLFEAHSAGMIHRDLKPANIMIVDADTPKERIKVMDFGLAKQLASELPIMNLTESNFEFAVGTPGYICPEQVKGEPVDHRSDLYSVGVMIYELLTGRLPFLGPSAMDLMLSHATEPPPSFEELGLSDLIPPQVEQVVMMCLAKDVGDRYQSARDLADAYKEALLLSESGITEAVGARPGDIAPYDIPMAVDNYASRSLHSLNSFNPSASYSNGATATAMATASAMALMAHDPSVMTHQVEAWMPESIAIMKLKGFADDFRGEIVESIPGMIRVKMWTGRLRKAQNGVFGIFGGKKPETVMMELHLNSVDPSRGNQLQIQVVFRPNSVHEVSDPDWRERCGSLFVQLRAYLMGTGQ